MKIIYIIFFFLYPQIRSNCSHLIKISSTSIFPTLLSNTKNFPSIPLSKAWTDIPFPSRKTLFSLPKHVPRESFDHSSFRYQQPGDTSSLWTKVHSHTHTFGIRFSASRADQFIDVVEGGKGRVTPWYLSPVPPGAWPKSNVVKIEIIRATTFHGNRVHPSTVSDPDNPQRPQPVNILQASFRRLEPEGVAPWRVAVTELSPPLTTRHPFSASLFGYVAISTRFRFFSRLNFWATSMKDSSRMNFHFVSTKRSSGSRFWLIVKLYRIWKCKCFLTGYYCYYLYNRITLYHS